MQAYDLIMLIVLAMATIFGAIKGFAWQVASIASVIISYIVAYRFRFDLADMIDATPPWNQFLAMLILYVATSFVIWVGFRLLSGMIDRVRLKEFDRHMGAGFGLLKGFIYCLLITMFAMSLLGENQQRAICQSRSGYYIAKALDQGVGILPKEIHDVVGPYLANLDDQLKSGQQGQPIPESPWQNSSVGQLLETGLPGFSGGSQDGLQSTPFSNQSFSNGAGTGSQWNSGGQWNSGMPSNATGSTANSSAGFTQSPPGQPTVPGGQIQLPPISGGTPQSTPQYPANPYPANPYPANSYPANSYPSGWFPGAQNTNGLNPGTTGYPSATDSVPFNSLRPTEQAQQPDYVLPRR